VGNYSVSAAFRLLIAASVVGCSPDLPDPTLNSVSPSEWYSGLDVELSILGTELYPAVQIASGEVDIDREYRAWLESPLGNVELEGVSLRSYTELSGWVRAGLAPGNYDLRVLTPTGTDILLPEAFRATDNAIKSIVLEYGGSPPVVNDKLSLDVKLEGWDGELVQQSMEIEVVVERDDGEPADVEFYETTLNDPRTLAEGVGIQGTLNQDGQGVFQFTSFSPGALMLEVRPIQAESTVSSATEVLFFDPGSLDSLDVSLSSDSRSFIAGDVLTVDLTLLDDQDNPTDVDDQLSVHLQELCSGEIGNDKYASILSTLTVSFEIQGATSEDCPENQIIARIVQDKGNLESASETFSVSPGAPDSYEVTTFINAVVAGEDVVLLLISVRDQFDNLITDYSESLVFTDSDGVPLVASCSPFSDGLAVCDVELYVAGEVRVTITNTADTLSGVSDGITVTPGEPSVVTLSTSPGASTADDGRDFSLQVTDAYYNNIPVPPTGSADSPGFSVGGTPATCTYGGSDINGYRYHCDLTETAVDRELTVTVLGLAALSPRFDVVNGALTQVRFSGPGDVYAGQTTTVNLSGFDAYDNSFIEVGSGSLDVELFDDSGDVSELITLGSDGTATLSSLSFTTAWESNHLQAQQSGLWLGTSVAFTISPADMDHFQVEPERIWGWVDETLSVTLSAVDPYENIITAYVGLVEVSSATGLGRLVAVSSWSGGTTTVDFTPTTAGFADSLSASDGTFTGTSTRLDVLDGDCTTPPTAALTVDGNAAGLACRSSGVTDALLLSATESDPGSATLTTWYFYTEPAGWQRTNTDTLTHIWSSEGAFEVSVVAATDTACADQISTMVYVANDDGEPAGPVTLTPASTTLRADTTASQGRTTVDVYAVTCSGTASSAGTLLLRTDIGDLSGAALTTSGAGLELLLDSSGAGTVTWTTGNQLFDGVGTITAGRLDGAAVGETSATLTGDAQLPWVIGVSPVGTNSSTISSLEVQFSESVLEDSINDSTVRILDPDGLAVDILDHALSDSVLELTLASDIDLSEGAWTLWLSSDVTDVGGNSLDGAYSGNASTFSLMLGQVDNDAPDLTACSLDVDAFHPDGDDGAGAEADFVTLSLTATDTATWWQLEILDSVGDLVALEHLASSGATGSLTWDGRGGDGFIVDNGDYTLRVSPQDDAWNEGAGCTTTVTVDNFLP
jgi:hypothetical protein